MPTKAHIMARSLIASRLRCSSVASDLLKICEPVIWVGAEQATLVAQLYVQDLSASVTTCHVRAINSYCSS
jgi:hypothetical protein